MEHRSGDIWAEGDAYERFIGRWSRAVALEFVRWLRIAPGSAWFDVGCGTGALVDAVLHEASPRSVLGVDRSPGFVHRARQQIDSPLASFEVGDALALPVRSDTFDVVVSGLVINFIDDPLAMVAEMARAARPRGAVGLYVWDYASGMQLLRAFWDAARVIDPASRDLDEGLRFPLCAPDRLEALLTSAGLTNIAARAIEVRTRFADFDDLWSPFLGGQGPAPTYVAALPERTRLALREGLRSALPIGPDGSIALDARAWAVTGRTAG